MEQGMRVSTDRDFIHIDVPGDMPFTAKSISEAVTALTPLGKPWASWTIEGGLRITLMPVHEIDIADTVAKIQSMELPLAVLQPDHDRKTLEVLWIETNYDYVSREESVYANVEPAQVITSNQLRDYLMEHTTGSKLAAELSAYDREQLVRLSNQWLMRADQGCLMVGAPILEDYDIFTKVFRPKYRAFGIISASIDFSSHGRTGVATISIKVGDSASDSGLNYEAIRSLPDVEGVEVCGRSVLVTYHGESVMMSDATELLLRLKAIAWPIAKRLGVHPAVDGEFSVTLKNQVLYGRDPENPMRAVCIASTFPVESERRARAVPAS